jgi:asparagine synthase (glutamine-hydrolysing)
MSAFVLLRGPDAEVRAERLRSRLAASAVSFDTTVSSPEGVLLFRSNPHLGGGDRLVSGDEASILFTGMFFYRGEFGREAIAKFLEDFDPRRPSLEGAMGQFCLILRKQQSLYLFVDPLGMNKVYCDAGQSVFSSLFLGVAETLDAPGIDVQGCYEYAWNGCSMGERTFYADVRTLRPGHYVAMDNRVAISALPELHLRDEDAEKLSPDDLVDRHVDRCVSLFRTYARHFEDKINLSISGGYDSRLMLALFLKVGVRPNLFCYGSVVEGAREVALAKALAEGEGLPFESIDKSQVPQLAPEAYAEEFRKTYGLFDGWKVDGLFDNGSDGLDRAARVASGRVKANGSAGEIYRNFFYLKDRPLFARELVWSFYARYDPGVCTSLFAPRSYERRLAAFIMNEVGADGPLLARYRAELAYPLVRVRYWTARDVQLNQAFGLCLFPFLEPSLVCGTCDIPIALKSYGTFEGRMIRQLNARVAAYPSDYGFPMSSDPPLRYVLGAQLSYSRPPFARRFLYRLRHRRLEPQPYYLSKEYIRELIDPAFPIMSRYFKVSAIRDTAVLNRVATMEYHAERHSAREGTA